MRRWLAAVALGGLTALTLGGCALPAGVDGNLTDDWAAIGEPVAVVPAVGACHPRFVEVGFLSSYQPVECAEQHDAETLYVGTFTGAEADRATPPPDGSPAWRTARAECDTKVNEVVGGDWRAGRLTLSLIPPSNYAWSGGARWFRCDVGEIDGLDNRDVVARTGSLKGAMSGASALAYGCFNPKLDADGEILEMQPVNCTAKHNTEFAGIWNGPDVSYDALLKDKGRIERGCLAAIASFAKVPNNGDMKYRSGWITYYPGEAEWDAGNRGVHCFLWLDKRQVTRSLRGAGSGGLPIN
ncbi:putative regulator of septum formation [Micromonospora pisi]|uniref:Putative regulator of septum formation n=1 Tax=Micromonospora pisi TaxID=589240 RepID=A0A495JUB3_9ACTN|nr:septum formation family protein [Micromonospora pisi]RKR91699.1 putative regulator of septum formation [Micromonospora pisi]